MSIHLEGGFQDPPRDAAFAFRALMNVMARPGEIQEITGAQPPEPLSVAAGALLLTLVDGGTPVYLAGDADCDAVREWLRFHTGAPLMGPAKCTFAVGAWEALTPLEAYPLGSPEYPDRSATLIVETDDLEAKGTVLKGPGIRDVSELSLPDPDACRANSAHFPLGLDFYFTCGSRVAALPRSTKVL